MVRAWLKQLGKSWFAGPARTRGPVKPSGRLGVETLEAREVPSTAGLDHFAVSVSTANAPTVPVNTVTVGTPLTVTITVKNESGHIDTNFHHKYIVLHSSNFGIFSGTEHANTTVEVVHGKATVSLTPVHSDVFEHISGVTLTAGGGGAAEGSDRLTVNPTGYDYLVLLQGTYWTSTTERFGQLNSGSFWQSPPTSIKLIEAVTVSSPDMQEAINAAKQMIINSVAASNPGAIVHLNVVATAWGGGPADGDFPPLPPVY